MSEIRAVCSENNIMSEKLAIRRKKTLSRTASELVPPLTLILDELDNLTPFASPFPDANRAKSTKSLFASPMRITTSTSLKRIKGRSKSSPRGFKKTKGSLDAHDFDITSYLAEDEDTFFTQGILFVEAIEPNLAPSSSPKEKWARKSKHSSTDGKKKAVIWDDKHDSHSAKHFDIASYFKEDEDAFGEDLFVVIQELHTKEENDSQSKKNKSFISSPTNILKGKNERKSQTSPKVLRKTKGVSGAHSDSHVDKGVHFGTHFRAEDDASSQEDEILVETSESRTKKIGEKIKKAATKKVIEKVNSFIAHGH